MVNHDGITLPALGGCPLTVYIRSSRKEEGGLVVTLQVKYPGGLATVEHYFATLGGNPWAPDTAAVIYRWTTGYGRQELKDLLMAV